MKPRRYHLPPPKNAMYLSGGIIELSAADDIINAGKPLPPVVELTPAGPPLLVTELREEDDLLRSSSATRSTAPQDFAKALEWCEKMAAQGQAEALFTLGFLYQSGLGVPQDLTKAREWYEKAAARGGAGAQANLGFLYERGCGVPQDYATARVWYEKAAEQGNAIALCNLASLYEQGLGGPVDLHRALELYGAAAAQGMTDAQDSLRRLGMSA